jgi:hypothetical protein
MAAKAKTTKTPPPTGDDTTTTDPTTEQNGTEQSSEGDDTKQDGDTPPAPDESQSSSTEGQDPSPPPPPEPEQPVEAAPAVEVVETVAVAAPEPVYLAYQSNVAGLAPGTHYYAHWLHDPRNTDQQRHVEQIAVDLASGAIQRRGLPASYWNSVVGNANAVPPVYRRGDGEPDSFVR